MKIILSTLVLLDLLFCQAQPNLQVQLEPELALFLFAQAKPPTPLRTYIFQHFSANVNQVTASLVGPELTELKKSNERDLNFLANSRRPQYFGKWKMTSIFWQMEDDLNV